MSEADHVHYIAAGAVVVHGERVLILLRPSRDEVRLPKGHIDKGEDPLETALRETYEESGYRRLRPLAGLGKQTVAFELDGKHVTRDEYYFLLELTADERTPLGDGEDQFEPVWVSWEEALSRLTFSAERQWVRRAQTLCAQRDQEESDEPHPSP